LPTKNHKQATGASPPPQEFSRLLEDTSVVHQNDPDDFKPDQRNDGGQIQTTKIWQDTADRLINRLQETL
jgi:hypothetical protein